jgi:hypothetical protein
MEDRVEIAQLFNQYANALDYKQWALLEDIFTDDATADWPASGTSEGRTEIIAFIKRALETDEIVTHHMWGNFSAAIYGDTAEAVVHMRAHHVGVGCRIGKFKESLGTFRARLERTPSGWRFNFWEERILVALGSQDLFAYGHERTD